MWQLFIVFLIAYTDALRGPDTRKKFSEEVDGRDGKGLEDPKKDTPTKPAPEFMERAPGPQILPDYIKPLILVHINDDDDDTPKLNNTKPQKKEPMWFDFPEMHSKNIEMAGTSLKDFRSRWRASVISPTPKSLPKAPYFKRQEYNIQDEPTQRFIKKRVINWTDCDEFGRGASFEPDDIVDLDWVPFFEWSTTVQVSNPVAFVHRFTKPTLRMALEYRERYEVALGNRVNWENAKLALKVESRTPKSYLLVATDKWGVLTLIPDIKIPETIRGTTAATVPIKKVRVRIFDPYLFMMDCGDEYAVFMALHGQGPETNKEKKQEASTIGFQGIGLPVGRSPEIEAMDAVFIDYLKANANSTSLF